MPNYLWVALKHIKDIQNVTCDVQRARLQFVTDLVSQAPVGTCSFAIRRAIVNERVGRGSGASIL